MAVLGFLSEVLQTLLGTSFIKVDGQVDEKVPLVGRLLIIDTAYM